MYQIELAPRAIKTLIKLPQNEQRKIAKKIDLLVQNPIPRGVKKLEGEKELYRLRSGDYRIIYQILNKKLLILILKIGHRKEIYRKI